MDEKVREELLTKFRGQFGIEPSVMAYAPGRVEVLGNHTDYNEGFVLSAAIDLGCFFAVSLSDDDTCRVLAGDLMKEAIARLETLTPSERSRWANYVFGVFARIVEMHSPKGGFNAAFLSNIPLASGLSSSAALEMSAALALAALYDVKIPKLELAKIGQWAEHNFAGVKCGLLDQISSLFGTENGLAENPAWTYTCAQIESRCAAAVNSAGDINNDGFGDVIIGAPNYDNAASDEGAALVFLGSADGLPVEPDWVFESTSADAHFGEAVASAGDVNNDGYDDILIGAPSLDQDESHLPAGGR